MAETIDEYRELIAAVLTDEAAHQVARYFDPQSHFAGATFDTLGSNDPLAFRSDDLLAVHLLGMSFDPLTVRRLFDPVSEVSREVARLLAAIPTDIDLWSCAADEALLACDELWRLLEDLDGVGWVTAGKLMARKRPRLVPILDQVVYDYFRPPTNGFWQLVQGALRDSDLPQSIESTLRPVGLAGPVDGVSTLRLLDVAIWMRGR